MEKFVNLTPHNVTINGDTIPSTGIARCEEVTLFSDSIQGISIDAKQYGGTVGLPERDPETILIVSHIVAQQNPDRDDLVWPGDLVRDEQGRVTGCRAFNQLPRHNKALWDHLKKQCKTDLETQVLANWKNCDYPTKRTEPLMDGTWLEVYQLDGGLKVRIYDPRKGNEYAVAVKMPQPAAYFKYAYDLRSKFGNGMFIGVAYDKDHNQATIPNVEPFVLEDGTMLYSNEGGHWLKPTQEEAKAYQDLIDFAVDQSMNNEYPSIMKELPVVQNKLILP